MNVISYSSNENVMTGDGIDNMLMCRKILNTFNGKRMISKPEASVLISTNMDLVSCSETIEKVPISQYFRIAITEAQAEVENYRLVKQYACRKEHLDKSLCWYYEASKENDTSATGDNIPHFIGLNYRPEYPPTISYAQGTLIIHKPWNQSNTLYFDKKTKEGQAKILDDFDKFIHSENCPERVKMQYAVAKYGYQRKKAFTEVRFSSNDPDYVPTTQDSDDEMIQHFDRLAASNIKHTTNISGIDCDLGLDFDWSICDYHVSC